ncbi:sigma-70 family RNA polymerase sigma factor [Brevibacillus laterosporus]|uniref:sigma-70 family RNA polymerase sigma factor n=1 Tax=Brevibacillus laterosporus TaxID=1465 RepID=UPI00265155F1|nr:sigma-70 family RNA polymerase sigma factor [Brevibacillus laterosporus]MDN9011091.1 sigma-70 family RNA polymerase sigma factor [Brevibacillus laterosporus]MDO0942114.1 sigma-70 family RNA polymerase sigma factor [Brevibacillus laterosporus]
MSKTRIDNPHLGCRDTFIRENRKLVYMIVHRYFLDVAKSTGISLDDLYSEGFVGLIKAYDSYDPTKFQGAPKFSTYAVPSIIGRIKEYLKRDGSLVRGPNYIIRMLPKVVKMDEEGKSVKEISEALQRSEQKVKDTLEYVSKQIPFTLEQQITDRNGDQTTLLDSLGVQDDITEIYVNEFLDKLSDRDRMIVDLVMKGFSQSEIGKKMGVFQSQIARRVAKIKKVWKSIREGTETSKNTGTVNKKRSKVTEYRTKKAERRDSVKAQEATPEGMKKHNIQTIVDLADWFTDVKLPDVPSIGINRHGISFNASAVEMMGLAKGMKLEIGFSLDHLSLVFRVGDKGAKLKQLSGQKSLTIVNKRLINWLLARSVIQKRYSLEVDQLTGVWISKVELGMKKEKPKGNVS